MDGKTPWDKLSSEIYPYSSLIFIVSSKKVFHILKCNFYWMFLFLFSSVCYFYFLFASLNNNYEVCGWIITDYL